MQRRMTEQLHLERKHREALEALLREHLPEVEVWAYGSRVNGRSHDGSDLDLVLRGSDLAEIPIDRLVDFEEAVRESNIPFLVEARDWASVPERFRREIEQEYVVLVSTGYSSAKFQTTSLDEVAKLTLSSVDKKTKQGELNILLCNYMDVYLRRFIQADIPFMTATATKREIERCRLQTEDVVITKDSEQHDDIGVPALIREDVDGLVCGYHLAILRPSKDKLHGPYLYYALQTEDTRQQFHSYANGITRFGLRKDDILRVQIPLPPLPEQRAIAHVLGTLDDKIELNQRMNRTLEAMARALFKSWFIDFDPVRARMALKRQSAQTYHSSPPHPPCSSAAAAPPPGGSDEAAGRSGTAGSSATPSQKGSDWTVERARACLDGMDPAIIDLFPDRLIASELGEIPQGWEASTIGEEVNAVGGGTPDTKELLYWNGGTHNWATPKDLSKLESPILLETDRKITDAGVRKISSGLLPAGTVLLSSRAPIGYLAIAGVPVAVNQGFIAMICKKRLPNIFVLNWCYDNLDYIKSISSGSTFPEISKKVFRPIPVLMPSWKILRAYEAIARPLYDRITTTMKETISLTQTRDTLLPKLISGEIRIHNAAKLVEMDSASHQVTISSHG